MPDTPHVDTAAFISALFDPLPAGFHALLWTRQDKRSHWLPADDTTAIAQAVTDLGNREHDVYAAVSVAAALPPANRRHNARITSDNSAGLMGLWADIDIRDADAHQKFNLPGSVEEAMALVESMGVRPSLVVHSGHGLQVWWLFTEFWSFDTPEDRARAASLAQRWNTTLRVRAAERGQTVDSTYDLARVMRVPGPMNRKVASAPVEVRLIEANPLRYEPDDLDAQCLDEKYLPAGMTPARTYQPDAVELSREANPAFEKFTATMANDDRFADTWNMNRREFNDQSPSTYDLSLASQVAQYGWTDQEIADLIISFRRHHKLDISKALRADYMQRTISKARDGAARESAAENVDEVAAELETAKASGDPDAIREARRGVLDVISAQVGIEVTHIIRFTSDPPVFRLETPTHSLNLGGAEGILRWEKFRTTVFQSVGVQIDRFKPAQWDTLTALFPQAWEDQDIGYEATERGEVYAWLAAYLNDKPPVGTMSEAVETESPYVDERKRTLFFGAALRRFLYYKFSERVTTKEMGAKLRTFGCTTDTVPSTTEDGRPTTRYVWVLPEDWQR